MFDLDREVSQWCRRACPSLFHRRKQIAELEDHLHCDIARLIQQGFSPEEAFRHATSQFGEIKMLRIEYRKNRNRLVSMIDRTVSRFLSLNMTRCSERMVAHRVLATSLVIGLLVGIGLLLQGTEVAQWTRSLMIALYSMPFTLLGTPT